MDTFHLTSRGVHWIQFFGLNVLVRLNFELLTVFLYLVRFKIFKTDKTEPIELYIVQIHALYIMFVI